jgi:hypothetical protein
VVVLVYNYLPLETAAVQARRVSAKALLAGRRGALPPEKKLEEVMMIIFEYDLEFEFGI